MFGLFTKARRKAAQEIKTEIYTMRQNAMLKQQKQSIGSDYWNRYQWQINSLNDLIATINDKFNLYNHL